MGGDGECETALPPKAEGQSHTSKSERKARVEDEKIMLHVYYMVSYHPRPARTVLSVVRLSSSTLLTLLSSVRALELE